MRKILLFCFSCLMGYYATAQDRVVTGMITSAEDGSPVPGVNIIVKGTSQGTVSDANGTYSISVPATGGTLSFSFIGLTTQEKEIGQLSVIDVQMSLDVTQLGEVVVTAQGNVRQMK